MNHLLAHFVGVLNVVIAIGFIAAGAIGGFEAFEGGYILNNIVGLVVGLVMGLLVALLVCGLVALLVEIHNELTKIRAALERSGR